MTLQLRTLPVGGVAAALGRLLLRFAVVLAVCAPLAPLRAAAPSVEDAYAWSSPSLQTHAALVSFQRQFGLRLNEFHHYRDLVDHTFEAVVSPNNDTLCSLAMVDLRASPQVLTVPELGDRYMSVMMVDLRAYNFRVLVSAPGRHALAVKGRGGDATGRVERTEAESDIVLLIVRTEVRGGPDLPVVHAVQDGLRLDALAPVADNRRPLGVPAADAHWVTKMRWVLDHSPALDPADSEYAAFIRQLEPTPENAAIGERTLTDLKAFGTTITDTKGMYGRRDRITVDHRTRAASNLYQHLALENERAAYPRVGTDADGRPLTGDGRYVMTFPRNVPLNEGGFWSVTVYDAGTKQFVPNEAKLYRVAGKVAVRDPDGGVTIRFGGERGEAANWLPLPARGRGWYLLVRLYEGGPEIVDGTWPIPAVTRTD
jgi:hypothetical protein